MSYKEVTALRKSGQLEAALEMAEQDLAREQSEWTCSAMFWCLNDMAKEQEGDALAATAARMHQLADSITDDKGYVAQSLSNIDRRLLPHRQEVEQADALSRTQGHEAEACDSLAALQETDNLDTRFHTTYAWCIYRALHADDATNALRRKRWLNNYLKLQVERPSLLHSLILGEAVRTERSTPQDFVFSTFAAMWDLANVRDDDWNQATTQDGKRIPSLIEKLISVYCKEMAVMPQLEPSDDFTRLLDRAIEKFPGNDNLPRYKAQMLIKQGHDNLAVDFYKALIAKNAGKVYLWSELAQLVDDRQLKISLLCNALLQRVQPEFVVKVRLRLATLLREAGENEQARHEIDKVKATYEQNNWRIPIEYYIEYNHLQLVTASGCNSYYAAHKKEAHDFIYGQLPSVTMVKAGVVIDEKRPGKKIAKWVMYSPTGEKTMVAARALGVPREARDGECYDITMQGRRPVAATKSAQQQHDWLRRVRGFLHLKVNREGKPYGKVEGFYIPQFMTSKLADKSLVDIVAIHIGDKWKCIAINRAENT